MTAGTHTEGVGHVLKTPIWVTIVRGLIVLISFVILALSGVLIHGAYIDEFGLNVATPVLTWLVIAYIVVTEKVPSAHSLYHVIAVIVLDAFMFVMWLATFAATAARRAQFIYDVDVNHCYNDGSLTNSNFCYRKREIEKRAILLFKTGQDMMAAMAGLGALVWVLFTACLVWESLMVFRGRKEGRFMFGTKKDEHQMQNQNPTGPVMVGPTGVVGPEKTEVYHQQQPVQPQGQYQTSLSAGQHPSQGYPSPGGTYNSPSPVSPPPASVSPYQAPQQAPYHAPHEMSGQQPIHPPQELYAQQQPYDPSQHHQQQPYQYQQDPSAQGYPAQQQQQQPQYPQHGNPSPVPAYHSELDAQQAQHYPQSTSPPPQTTQQPQ